MNLLDLDARWRRLNDPDYSCPCCGQSFGGLVDMGFEEPDAWPFGERGDAEVFEAGDDKLSADLCRVGERRFLRAILPLPVRGAEDAALFALWAEVAPEDFYATLDAIDAGTEPPACPATLANELPEFGLPDGTLVPGTEAERPTFRAGSGPLAEVQEAGLSFDALLDLYAALGQDIRPHLQG
ncbi:hypothetical protein OCH239_00920 [Roseivivax halodurans JCM 10272]|uniref:DUF2199 domain-containing protein n=1 Tax=Roseivivax halodurans JCM 10272 TaxID=1449350 RepID=X7EKP2_9RHOB|nr:DUF2199 domain-containing protein [Roseivivax halodurans]ETX16430.1 hypothetical protein OCH239_00920 [Roseivivax halodurans JCM 10272]